MTQARFIAGLNKSSCEKQILNESNIIDALIKRQ